MNKTLSRRSLLSRVTPVLRPTRLWSGVALAAALAGHAASAHGPECRVEGCGKSAAAARWQAWVDANGGSFSEDPVGDSIACRGLDQTDLLNCNLQIEVTPSPAFISGTNAMQIRSLTDGLSQFTFRLRTQYVISSATVTDSTGAVFPVTVTNPSTTTRIASLPRAFNSGEVFTLTVSYSGTPMSVGLGSIDFGPQTGGTDPFMGSLSEPYYAYSWWPCKDGDVSQAGDNSDKFTLQFSITAPSTLKSVGPGLLEGIDTLSGSRSRYRWVTNTPIATYLVFFATSNYNQWQRTYSYPLAGGGTGTMPVHFSLYPQSDNATNRTNAEKVLQMMATLRPYYGEYPFVNEKYGIYQFEFGGGMEHQTYSGQSAFGESLSVHELGHQWWGDHVTCKTWSDIWLNEGFASYTEALWAEKKPGSTGLAALKAYMTSTLNVTTQTGVVYKSNVSNVNTVFEYATSYQKAAWVVHMLRHVMGDTTFWSALQQYRTQFAGSAASTADFQGVMETASGRSLQAFFNQWVYGAGIPAYAIGSQSVVIDGQNYLKVRLRQTQTANSVVFDMPVDVRFTVGGAPVTAVVRNNALTQWYLLPIAGAAGAASVDPDSWILATARASEAFVAGPPKIVSASVVPGSVLSAAPSSISVRLSETATPPAGSVTLVRLPSTVVAASVSGGGASPIVVTPSAPLTPGSYELRLSDAITANGFGLDGEISGSGAAALPSGNGTPGGPAAIAFTISAPAGCAADCDASGALSPADFTCFLGKYRAGDLASADCDASGALSPADFTCFLGKYRAGCP